MLSILIADDHEVTRRGLREILQDEFGPIDIGEAGDGGRALGMLRERDWNLVLLDIVMPGLSVGSTVSQMRQTHPKLPILVLTAVTELEYVIQTLKAGVSGYINKQHASDELIRAVKTVLAGGTYLSGDAVSQLAANIRGENTKMPHQRLSERELQVFCLIARGRTIKEIAGELEVSDKTVGTYLARIKEKTDLVSYVEITRYALQNRLVS